MNASIAVLSVAAERNRRVRKVDAPSARKARRRKLRSTIVAQHNTAASVTRTSTAVTRNGIEKRWRSRNSDRRLRGAEEFLAAFGNPKMTGSYLDNGLLIPEPGFTPSTTFPSRTTSTPFTDTNVI